jgi:hypothetical protein
MVFRIRRGKKEVESFLPVVCDRNSVSKLLELLLKNSLLWCGQLVKHKIVRFTYVD